MATLAEIRARAKAHEDEIVSVKWFTVIQLAERWQLGRSTIYEIPIEQLRYQAFGKGATHGRRRYREDWVIAYETSTQRASGG